MFLFKLPLAAKFLLGAVIGSLVGVWAYARSGPRQDAEYDFLTLEKDLRDQIADVYKNGTLIEKADAGEWLRANGYAEAARHFPG